MGAILTRLRELQPSARCARGCGCRQPCGPSSGATESRRSPRPGGARPPSHRGGATRRLSEGRSHPRGSCDHRNLGGVAYAARDEANRIWLEDQLADARAALRRRKAPTYDEILGGLRRGPGICRAARPGTFPGEGFGGHRIVVDRPDGVPLDTSSPSRRIAPLSPRSHRRPRHRGKSPTRFGHGTTTKIWVGGRVLPRTSSICKYQMDRADNHAVVAWVGYRRLPSLPRGVDVMSKRVCRERCDETGPRPSALETLHPELTSRCSIPTGRRRHPSP